MVNYKRVVCEVAFLAVVLTVVSGAPTSDCTEAYYDQRQNGSENYRINIDGVIIAVAPAETFVEAVSDFSDLFDISDLEDILKPPSSGSTTTKPEANDSKPDSEKPAESPISDVSLQSETKAQKKEASIVKSGKIQRLKHRLANVLIPLLRKHANNDAKRIKS